MKMNKAIESIKTIAILAIALVLFCTVMIAWLTSDEYINQGRFSKQAMEVMEIANK